MKINTDVVLVKSFKSVCILGYGDELFVKVLDKLVVFIFVTTYCRHYDLKLV